MLPGLLLGLIYERRGSGILPSPYTGCCIAPVLTLQKRCDIPLFIRPALALRRTGGRNGACEREHSPILAVVHN